MGLKKLTLSGQSVERAVRDGLERIGLERDDTYVRILRKARQGWFGHEDAVVSIIYDGDQSERALLECAMAEFRAKFQVSYKDEAIWLFIPPSFFEDILLHTQDDRVNYLQEYLEAEGVKDIDVELLNDLSSLTEAPIEAVQIKKLECEPLNERGASIRWELSEDEMEVKALVFNPSATTEEEILTFAKRKGVVNGVLINNIRCVLKSELSTPFTLARGEPPLDDQPGDLEKYFQEDEHKQFAEMMELVQIDTRSVKDINIAERHQLLVRIGDIKIGRDGYTVTGRVLPKENLNESASGVILGENVYFNDHRNEIYSREPGHIVWDADLGLIDVEPVYIVEGDVDFSEGNIIGFVGKVIIKGDVKPHFSVIAERDIEIHGSVEDATVKSTAGSVLVGSSIIHRTGGLVQAKKTVQCAIAKNAHVKAENITIYKEATNCSFQASKEVSVEGTPGCLIGGQVDVTYKMRVNQLGSDRGVATIINVGDVAELKKELRKLSQQSDRQEAELKEARQVVKILSRRNREHGLTPSQEAQLEKAQAVVPDLQEALSFAKEKEEALRDEIKRRKNGRLEILGTLYPQVTVNIFEATFSPNTAEKYTGLRCAHGTVKRYSL